MKRKFNLGLLPVVLGMLLLVVVDSEIGFAASAWQDEWERVLKAAKSEGKLTLVGPLGADRRDTLPQAFQSKYGITVEYHSDAGAGIFPRLNAERKAGLFLWDVLISGTSTVLEALIPNKFLDPLEPALILPEIKDAKYWRGGALEFLDPGRHSVIMTLTEEPSMSILISSAPRSLLRIRTYSRRNGRGKLLPTTQENPAPVREPSCFFTATLSWVRILSDL